MGRKVLPESIDPSTSVPTYIVKGEEYEVSGINVFDSKVQMQVKDIKKIAHGFGELEDEDDEPITTSVTLGHVLKSLFFSTPLHTYDHIAFLDTPGYSKPDTKDYSAKTDEQIARRQLNSSNYILWFTRADSGTVTSEDIRFIKSLNNDIPILFIVNKADQKQYADLQEIIRNNKSTLNLKGIRYVDVLPFSSRLEQVNEESLLHFIEEGKKQIISYIQNWNSQVYESNFARNFKKLFVRCRDFYDDEIDNESRKLSKLNTSVTKLGAEDIEQDVLEPLQSLIKEYQNRVNALRAISLRLKELQNEFFTEIKLIADAVNIDMPEPSEIELIRDKMQNPSQLIEQYKKENGIQTDLSMLDMLMDTFTNIDPIIKKTPGGSLYAKELVSIIEENCNVAPENIHINDVFKKNAEYKKMIADQLEKNYE